ncbi:MAG TPA: DUF2298 domain-containing protein [Patescibacteria group bacterium]|nr:DUF2298 domain-containing protein [Patescibacteria group bacterium]
MIHYTFLFIGLIYTTILPGFVLVELFFPKLAFFKKFPLYLILSVITSCYFSYFASVVFGFTRETLLGCFLFFLALFVYILAKKKINVGPGIRSNWQVILIGLLIYLAFFISLYPAIFKFFNGYFVMGGPNWQDTAMHLSIIQSLTQGNFPPQAPYFSGQPLSYYYFSDFHAAIVNTMFGDFFPEILVLINPFFAMLFFLSVFALSYSITKKKIFSIISGIGAVLYGNFGFVNMAKELISTHGSYIALVTTNPFNFDKGYLQMTPMADYFLQNRPMLVGLPALVLIILLLQKNKKTDQSYVSKIFLAGIITASLLKFQFFGFIISWIFFGIYFGLNFIFKKINIRKLFIYLFVFGIPSLILVLIFGFTKVEGRSLITIFIDSFSWGPWQKYGFSWFIYFLLGNLGIGFLIYLFGIPMKKPWKNIEILGIYITSIVLVAIPLIMKFTIYEFDMLKFYYYLVPLICVLLAYFYAKSKYRKLSIFIFILVTIISSVTSINMLVHSYLSKTQGYSLSDYEVGNWILSNTDQRSVFVTMPTVHSASSDIGGRLRIISYINWPYSHGFNSGPDNVFSRVDDVTEVYKTGDISLVKLKYDADYVFYGGDERGLFSEAYKLFDASKSLKLVYNRDGTEIYKILK